MLRARIDFNLFRKKQPEQLSGGHVAGALKEVMSENPALAEVVKQIQYNTLVHWVSNGDWSMHEMLLALLNVTGPAKVHISSYALCETAARVMVQLKNAGTIQKLYAILDSRIDKRSAGSLQVMKAICNRMALVDTHAKVTVIQNDNWHVTVVGSANYTVNKRWESGIITCQEQTAAMQVKWITKALKDGNTA